MAFIGARPGLDLEVFLLGLVIVVVGGIGNLMGAYFAALLVGLIDSVGKLVIPEASLFLLFVPMAVFLVFRPTGISGRPLNVAAAAEIRRTSRQSFARAAAWIGQGVLCVGRVPNWAWAAAAVAALVILPWLVPGYYVKLVALALIWSIFAMGFNVVLGYAGMPSLGHAAFFGAGAYAVALLSRHTGWDGWVLLIMAVACAATLAAILGTIALRTRLVYFLLATVALAQVLWGIVFKWRAVTGGDDGLQNSQMIGWIPGLAPNMASQLYYVVLSVFAAAFAVMLLVHRSHFRLVLNGLRDNEARLQALGYGTWLYQFGAFVLSGAYGGLAGGLFAFYAGFVSPELLGVVTSAEVLLMVILGGAGTILGPVVGAFGLVFLEEILSAWTDRWQIVEGFVFAAVVLAARRGIVGLLQDLSRQEKARLAGERAT
jgi:branched-chain amino acid transport system permease protein